LDSLTTIPSAPEVAPQTREYLTSWRRLDARDVCGLESLGALRDIELYGFALVQAAISRFLNGGKMYENILARRALDETEALGSIEPLDCAFFSQNLLLSHVRLAITPASRKFPDASVHATRSRLHVAGKQGCRSVRSSFAMKKSTAFRSVALRAARSRETSFQDVQFEC
jgi:hypothetical protein